MTMTPAGDAGRRHGHAVVDINIGCSVLTDRRDVFMKKGKVMVMTSALFSKRPRRVDVMKGYEPMYDATMQECLQRPFYLYARGKGVPVARRYGFSPRSSGSCPLL